MNDYHYELYAPDPDGPRSYRWDEESKTLWTWTDYEIEEYILKKNPDGRPRVTVLPNGEQVPNQWVANALRRHERNRA